jgi:hypothetical protein
MLRRTMTASLCLGTCLLAFGPVTAGAAPYGKKISCAQARKILTKAGYEVFSIDGCRGRVYTASTLKGEAVTVKFDSRTGKWLNIFGGD